MRQTPAAVLLAFLLPALGVDLAAQDIAKAEMFYKHRLVDDAKREAIHSLFASTDPKVLMQCKQLLARIAVEEHRIDDAVELWQDIAAHHPGTPEAAAANLLVKQWATMPRVAGPQQDIDPLAAAYLTAADFWTRDIPRNPIIDVAWLGTEEAAESWLRKVVTEFPGTPAAATALAEIARVWIGFGGDEHSPACGALGLANTPEEQRGKGFEQALALKMAKAEQAIGELETNFPAAPEIPQLQFLIAQAYWAHKNQARAEQWLQRCAKPSSTETFWTHLARLRLQHWHRG